MGFDWTYEPPTVNPVAVLEAVKTVAETAGAQVLLAASQPLVPVDTGALKASGTITTGPDGAHVSYSAVNERDGYNYAARQHEDAALHHPNGGQMHYLSQPMHTEQAAILAAQADVLRVALR